MEDILTFPIESSHAYSYAHLSPNSLALRLNVLKRSLEILKDRPDLIKSHFLGGGTLGDGNRMVSGNRNDSRNASTSYPSRISGERSPNMENTPIYSLTLGHNIYAHGHSAPENSMNNNYKLETNASSAALSAFFRPPMKRSDSMPITREILEDDDDALSPSKAGMTGVTRVVSSSAAFSNDNILRDDLKDIITLLENDLDSLVQSNSEIASTLHDLSLSTNYKGNDILNENHHIRYEFVKNKLLYALATPFVENSAMTSSLLQSDGTGSLATNTVRPSTTALNLLNSNYTTPSSFNSTNPSSYGAPMSSSFSSNNSNRPFHAMPSTKHALPQSVFTVEVDNPWSVKAANDLACLMFGVSKNMIRALTLMDLIAPQFRDLVMGRLNNYISSNLDLSMRSNRRNAKGKKNNDILFAGEIVAIARPGDQNYAWTSMWAKRKGDLIICMFDQIPCDAFDVVISKKKEDATTSIAGKLIDRFDTSIFERLSDISESLDYELRHGISSQSDSLSSSYTADTSPMQVDYDDDDIDPSYFDSQDVSDSAFINRTRYYTLQFKENENIPCAITSNPLEINSDKYEIKLKVHSMPYIAGIFVISTDNYHILSCNNAIAKNMFGRSSEALNGQSIDKIIPNFTRILHTGLTENCDAIKLTPGLVLPEHFFRKYEAVLKHQDSPHQDAEEFFFNSRGIEGLHRDGKTIYIDVQVRASTYDALVVWVTYSRSATKRNISKELDRLSSSTSSLSLSSGDRSAVSLTSMSDTKQRTKSQLKLLAEKESEFLEFTPNRSDIARQNSTRKPKNGSFGIPVRYMNNSLDKVRSEERLNSSLGLTPRTSDSRAVSDGSTFTASSRIPPSEGSQDTQATSVSGVDPLTEDGIHMEVGDKTYRTFSEEEILAIEQSMLEEKMLNSKNWPKEVGSKRRSKKFSEFKVLKDMGEGAYGKVVLAQHIEDEAYKIIVKCIDKERILVDTWVRDRKLGTIPSEIQIMAFLNSEPHPNIMRIVDFFEDQKYYYLETPIFGDPPAIDLFDYIEVKKDLTELECQFIFKQVVSSIYHLHKHGIVHRDIKDENVIVDENGVIKLIDFGSAGYTRSGPFDVFVGTIDYASPEVLRGEKYEGKPQDIWALGILLYTMLYKENPFYNVDEIMEGDLRVPYVISESSLKLINKILVREVSQRPTITDIVEDEWLQI
ncbi:uncharacterized protein RJT20DRAFT_144027 [Scheffersomyces xylosifermentans]|uniref:uncharacterized protein n=1 Tax=Scheffersomyces xylosifermentans TaxID=1304137 RepID=UPI00315DFA61